MTEQDPRMSQWIDTDAAIQRASEVHREAGKLAELFAAGARWWDQLDQQDGFRDRWARITGRQT